MARFGGFMGGGGGGNMQALMRQAQKMQEEALKAQEEIDETDVEGVSGGGMVKVVLKGNKNPVSINIDPSVVDPDDIEMLEDLIVAALSDAANNADKLKNEKMGRFGGLM